MQASENFYPRCRQEHPVFGRCELDAAHDDRHRGQLGHSVGHWPDTLLDKHAARGAVVEHASRLGMPNAGQTLIIFDANLKLLENVQKALDCTRDQLAILFAATEATHAEG